jgi:uncharacterized membrane protein
MGTLEKNTPMLLFLALGFFMLLIFPPLITPYVTGVFGTYVTYGVTLITLLVFWLVFKYSRKKLKVKES